MCGSTFNSIRGYKAVWGCWVFIGAYFWVWRNEGRVLVWRTTHVPEIVFPESVPSLFAPCIFSLLSYFPSFCPSFPPSFLPPFLPSSIPSFLPPFLLSVFIASLRSLSVMSLSKSELCFLSWWFVCRDRAPAQAIFVESVPGTQQQYLYVLVYLCICLRPYFRCYDPSGIVWCMIWYMFPNARTVLGFCSMTLFLPWWHSCFHGGSFVAFFYVVRVYNRTYFLAVQRNKAESTSYQRVHIILYRTMSALALFL